ncbi:LCP family protein [Nocardioides conyzicola]|uniref:LCP family protein n=1 Tax=Nocardioides conyzicola TaxID=1651781 RepID=A0ABP8WJ26_9ACTN
MSKATRHQRRNVLRVILVTELVIALLTGATVVFAYNKVDNRIDTGDDIVHQVAPPKKRALPTSALNILVLGTDTRSCAGCGIDHESGKGGSDLTILLHVAEGRKSAYGISIPRDTLVDRPACTAEDGTAVPAATSVMWNDALAVGGPACTAAQVEAVTGVYIDEYLVIDFAGFKDMVDAIHGVEVCLPAAVDDTEHNIHLDAGTQTLHGEDSLAYVRQRSSTPNSDIGRMRRQQAFIASMLSKVTSAGTLTNPTKVYNFAKAFAGSITTSPELSSVSKLYKLGLSLRGANLDKIRFVTAPTTDFPIDDPNWGRLQFTDAAPALWAKVKKDEPLGTLGKGAISGQNKSGSKAEAATNGLCS